MAATIQKRASVARASGLAVMAAMLCVFFSVAGAHRGYAQEPGTPPETAAPEPDNSAQQNDAAPEGSQNAQPAPGASQADAFQGPPSSAAEPDLPKWPINDKPGRATVTWDSHGLAVTAANSSLQQIVRDICTATGSKIEGLNKDERVFGEYGPGQARDVLSQLLQGAGYNVIMVGDQGQGAPRQILLSTRRAGGNQPNRGQANNNNDDDVPDSEPQEEPVQPDQPNHPNFPGGPPRSPQQMQQERQERMQRMQQMQQQQIQQQQPQQQNNP